MKIKFKDGSEKEFADLCGADLRDADLRDADLRDANLRDANLRYADLRYADLSGANLSRTDLSRADLRGTNLIGADIDFSCWPLWCGSLSPIIDKRIACQLLYHAMMAMRGCDDSEVKEFLGNNQAIALMNQFHRADECGKNLKKEVI
jgi:uncharacterized protein YjbI with pentapeptide repeats